VVSTIVSNCAFPFTQRVDEPPQRQQNLERKKVPLLPWLMQEELALEPRVALLLQLLETPPTMQRHSVETG
jgi:hypothetical protein